MLGEQDAQQANRLHVQAQGFSQFLADPLSFRGFAAGAEILLLRDIQVLCRDMEGPVLFPETVYITSAVAECYCLRAL